MLDRSPLNYCCCLLHLLFVCLFVCTGDFIYSDSLTPYGIGTHDLPLTERTLYQLGKKADDIWLHTCKCTSLDCGLAPLLGGASISRVGVAGRIDIQIC